MVGYTEVILQRVREVIEANRRGTWTINADHGQVESGANADTALRLSIALSEVGFAATPFCEIEFP